LTQAWYLSFAIPSLLPKSINTIDLLFTKQAQKDAKKIGSSDLKPNAQKLLNLFENEPLQQYPTSEKLLGDLSGAYPRRINIQHRLVYKVLEDKKVIKVIRMSPHYE